MGGSGNAPDSKWIRICGRRDRGGVLITKGQNGQATWADVGLAAAAAFANPVAALPQDEDELSVTKTGFPIGSAGINDVAAFS
jgi:hypothetical protein